VALFTDAIGFRQPGAKVGIDFAQLTKSKKVHVIARGESFDPPETRMLQPAREDDVAIEPLLTRRDLREGHSHLKCDPGFLRQNTDRSAAAHGRHDRVEERSNLRRFSVKMIAQAVACDWLRLANSRRHFAQRQRGGRSPSGLRRAAGIRVILSPRPRWKRVREAAASLTTLRPARRVAAHAPPAPSAAHGTGPAEKPRGMKRTTQGPN